MKKTNLKCLSLLSVALLLAGCDGKGGSVSDKGFVKELTTITIWHTSSYNEKLEQFAEKFKEIEPNVTVTLNKISAGYDALADQIIEGFGANNYPDMFLGYPDAVQSMIEYDKVVRLDDYMNNSEYGWTKESKDDIVENYLSEGQQYSIPGTYSLPFMKSSEAMYYNKDILGINLASIDSTINNGNPINETYLNNLTWEDLFEHLCPALKTYNDGLEETKKLWIDNSTYTKAMFGYDSDSNLFITLAKQYGYDYTALDEESGNGKILFNNDNMKGLMKTFNKAYRDGYFFTKNSSNGANYTNYSFTAKASIFSVGSTGGSKYQVSDNFSTGVARIPHAKDGTMNIINQGPGLAILNKGSENQKLASWLFYKFMTNEQNAEDLAENTGYFPIRYSVYESDNWKEFTSTEGKTAKDEILSADVANYSQSIVNYQFVSPVFKGSAKARTAVDSLVGTCVSATGTDAEIESKINDAFATAENTARQALGA